MFFFLRLVGTINVALGRPVIDLNGTCVGQTGRATPPCDGSYVTDGVIEPEEQDWRDNATHWDRGTLELNEFDPVFAIDLGSVYYVSGFLVQADCNDLYHIKYRYSVSRFLCTSSNGDTVQICRKFPARKSSGRSV